MPIRLNFTLTRQLATAAALAPFTLLPLAGCGSGNSNNLNRSGAPMSTGTTTTSRTTTTTFVSGPSWNVTDISDNSLGSAEYVLVNNSYPAYQPPGAINYGSAANSPSWAANLSTIPGAGWIWAPGITGSSPNASLAQYSFSKQFNINGTPTAGTISVAADDSASVFVNGKAVGSIGSITDAGVAYQAQSALTKFDITPYLVSGQNTIVVTAQNGPASFSGATNPDYSVNTAGVVFGGSISSNTATVQ